MDVAAVALKQAVTQGEAGVAMLKQQAQAEKSVANLVEHAVQSAPTGGRGKNLNIVV